VSLMLIQGYADRLVSEDSSLDHVVSSLAVHHLEDGDRLTFAREALRTLRRGGKITIIDFGGPTDAADDGTDTGGHVHQGQHGHEHGHGHGVRHLPGLLRSLVTRKPAAAHDMGVDLPRLLTEAGFRDAREVGYVDHRLGRISFVQATRP
jgi:SAM-dependent methyltransferase